MCTSPKGNGAAIKIGRSSDVPQRMLSLRCPEGGRVKLLAVFEGIGKYEHTIHRALADSSLGDGEWFHPSPLIQRLLAARSPQHLLEIIGVKARNLVQMDDANERDQLDLERAKQMVRDGRALRQRVLARIRIRRKRTRDAKILSDTFAL
jgi:hypothetical protein